MISFRKFMFRTKSPEGKILLMALFIFPFYYIIIIYFSLE
jgi:hypothetical protein